VEHIYMLVSELITLIMSWQEWAIALQMDVF
jgi:hypothetical protein